MLYVNGPDGRRRPMGPSLRSTSRQVPETEAPLRPMSASLQQEYESDSAAADFRAWMSSVSAGKPGSSAVPSAGMPSVPQGEYDAAYIRRLAEAAQAKTKVPIASSAEHIHAMAPPVAAAHVDGSYDADDCDDATPSGIVWGPAGLTDEDKQAIIKEAERQQAGPVMDIEDFDALEESVSMGGGRRGGDDEGTERPQSDHFGVTDDGETSPTISGTVDTAHSKPATVTPLHQNGPRDVYVPTGTVTGRLYAPSSQAQSVSHTASQGRSATGVPGMADTAEEGEGIMLHGNTGGTKLPPAQVRRDEW